MATAGVQQMRKLVDGSMRLIAVLIRCSGCAAADTGAPPSQSTGRPRCCSPCWAPQPRRGVGRRSSEYLILAWWPPRWAWSLERLALVPEPGPDWPQVVAALLDGIDVVAVAAPAATPAVLARRLAARARQRSAVLVSSGAWPAAELTIEADHGVWYGLSGGPVRRGCAAALSGADRGRAWSWGGRTPPPCIDVAAGVERTVADGRRAGGCPGGTAPARRCGLRRHGVVGAGRVRAARASRISVCRWRGSA